MRSRVSLHEIQLGEQKKFEEFETAANSARIVLVLMLLNLFGQMVIATLDHSNLGPRTTSIYPEIVKYGE